MAVPSPQWIERLRDGTAVRLGLLRPEDEPLLRDLAGHMNPEDLRLRFHAPLRELGGELLARLTRLDQDHTLAILAQPAATDIALGIARFAADPQKNCAEFALAVRSDWKRRGLGRLLMNRLIATARQHGIGSLFGEVRAENQPVLGLCRSLGFALGRHPDDPTTLRATLALRPGASPNPPSR